MRKTSNKYKGFTWRIENDPKRREEAIKMDIPVRFEIEQDEQQAKKLNIFDDLYHLDSLGKKQSKKMMIRF